MDDFLKREQKAASAQKPVPAAVPSRLSASGLSRSPVPGSVRSPVSGPARSEAGSNPGQAEAIAHRDGPMLVLAGPGSGKTYTITQRIRCLIEEGGTHPDSILVITFTRAAAEEMKGRFLRLTDGKF